VGAQLIDRVAAMTLMVSDTGADALCVEVAPATTCTVHVPWPVKTRVDPLENEQPAVPVDVTKYVKAPLALAVAAVSVVGDATAVKTVVGAQLTVCGARVIVTGTPVLVAAAFSASAAIVAATTQVPAAVAVRAAPETVQGPDVTANDFAPVPVLPEVDSSMLDVAGIVVASGTTVMVCGTRPVLTAGLAAEIAPGPMRFVARTVIV